MTPKTERDLAILILVTKWLAIVVLCGTVISTVCTPRRIKKYLESKRQKNSRVG